MTTEKSRIRNVLAIPVGQSYVWVCQPFERGLNVDLRRMSQGTAEALRSKMR